MPEENFIEFSNAHVSNGHPYWHVDAFVRDSITGKKIRKIGDGYPVDW